MYALGVILYEMCSKKQEGDIHIREVVADVKQLGYSPELISILEMFLEPSQDDRKSILEIINENSKLQKEMHKIANNANFKQEYMECYDFKFRVKAAARREQKLYEDMKTEAEDQLELEKSRQEEYIGLIRGATDAQK